MLHKLIHLKESSYFIQFVLSFDTCNIILLLVMKECFCHFEKWQIHSLISKLTYGKHVIEKEDFSLMQTNLLPFIWIMHLIETAVAYQTSMRKRQLIEKKHPVLPV